jgi:hypothetical protein
MAQKASWESWTSSRFVISTDSLFSSLTICTQVFVESLDRAFENVCELDLVFQFDEVFHFGKDILRGIYTFKGPSYPGGNYSGRIGSRNQCRGN